MSLFPPLLTSSFHHETTMQEPTFEYYSPVKNPLVFVSKLQEASVQCLWLLALDLLLTQLFLRIL